MSRWRALRRLGARYAPSLALGFALLSAEAPVAASEVDLRRLFPRAAPIELPDPSGSAVVRLELPGAVLAECRADLSDLRILDGRGVQVPFVLDRGAPRPLGSTQLKRVIADVLGADRHEDGRKDAPNAILETYELRAPPAPPTGTRWNLVVESALPDFVRQIHVAGKPAKGAPIELVKASVFRLKSGHGERTRTELPAIQTPRLIVRLWGQGHASLEPRFIYEALEDVPPLPSALIPLELLPPSDPKTSRFELVRPAGIVPSALRLDTQTQAFERRVEVRDGGQGSQQALLGGGFVFRLPGAAPSENLELPLAAASGQHLEVSIDDGDSPALEGLSFSAVIATPSLVFALPSGQPATLYFGGGRAHAPRYDLALLTRQRSEPLPPSASARLGALADNPTFDRTPALAFAMRPGSPVDDRLYTHQRRLELEPSLDGLARVLLGADDLASLRPDYADLRVVDVEGRQWPYLLEVARHVEVVPLGIGSSRRQGKSSGQDLTLPFGLIAASAIELDIAESYFDRAYRLSGTSVEGKSLDLGSGRLTRSAAQPPEPLRLELSTARVKSFELVVDDGDNAPLTLRAVRARVAVPNLYIPAHEGAYRLLLGNPSDAPPSYDIERARELVLAVSSRENRAEPLAPNPNYRSAARLARGDGPTNLLFWGALVLAVVVLGALTLKLARQGGGTPAA